MFKINEIRTAISLVIQGAAAERPIEEILEAIRREVEDWERGEELDKDYQRNYEGK